VRLSRAELEGLGFCYNSSLPLEGCVAAEICRCALRNADAAEIEDFRREVADDLQIINEVRRDARADRGAGDGAGHRRGADLA
jgi:hypothetical protein